MNDDRGFQAHCLYRAGTVFLEAKQYFDALRHLESSLELAENEGDSELEIGCLNAMAGAYVRLADDALESGNVIEVPSKGGTLLSVALDTARRAATIAAKLHAGGSESPHLAALEANCSLIHAKWLFESALVRLAKDDVDAAFALYQNARVAARDSGDRALEANCLVKLSEIFELRMDYKNTLICLEDALEIAEPLLGPRNKQVVSLRSHIKELDRKMR